MPSPRGLEKGVPVPSASGGGRREPSLAALVLLAALAAVPSVARAQDSATAEPVAGGVSATAGVTATARDSAAAEELEAAEATEAAAAAPAEPVERRFSFDAFGTLGLVYSTEDRADFAWLPTRPDGAGHSHGVSPASDSILGGQVTFQANPRLSAVVQVVVEQTADDDYRPQLEWANVRYAFTPDFSARVGRMALPAFMASEHRKVSYANPWMRPPVELYGMVPLFTLDGLETTVRLRAGDWTNTVGAIYGRAEVELPGDSASIEANDAWNLNTTFQRGGFTGRLAVAHGHLDIEAFDPFFAGFRAFGPEGEAIAERYAVDHSDLLFASAGAEYDPGGWFAIAEVGWSDSDSALGERLAGYVTGGYRRGTITPFVTYSRSELLSESSARGLSLAGLPPALVPMAAGLNAGLDGILGSAAQQQNLALGGRWDFATGLAFKLQVDLIDVLGDSPGTFINRQPGFEPGGSAQVVSFATVFVF